MQYLLGGNKGGVVKGKVPFAKVSLSDDERKNGADQIQAGAGSRDPNAGIFMLFCLHSSGLVKTMVSHFFLLLINCFNIRWLRK